MRSSLILGCVTALITCFSRDAIGEKPIMVPDVDTLSIKLRDPLRIECYSEGARVQFSLPRSTFLVPQSKYEIIPNENGTYTFFRENTSNADTGWYACAKEGIEIDNDFRNLNHTDEDIRWIYVAVNDEYLTYFVNAVNVYDLDPPNVIIVTTSSVIVVPCRVTNLNASVEFWQNDKLVDLEAEAVRFDPRIGFVMKRVAFVEGEAHLQCRLAPRSAPFSSDFRGLRDTYILRYANPKPTMRTERDDHLILQEGETLRIECSSATNFSFIFPKLSPDWSSYQIEENGNGTRTFLRRNVVSEDTGWYGCAGLDVRNNYIPSYSIEYTRKEISWIYVYVNSSVSIVLGFGDSRDSYLAATHYPIIPCRPTLPGLEIRLYSWVDSAQNWTHHHSFEAFDPKVGFLIDLLASGGDVFRCETYGPLRYVTKNYSFLNRYRINDPFQPAISELDASSASKDVIIRLTGDDLHLRCEWNSPAPSEFPVNCSVPSTVLENRVKYSWDRTDVEVERETYRKREAWILSITNITEIDSGEYACSVDVFFHHFELSRQQGICFSPTDKNEVQSMKLGTREAYTKIIGQEGKDITVLLDLTDFSSAQIECHFYGKYFEEHPCESTTRLSMITAVEKGASRIIFSFMKTKVTDAKTYYLSTRIGDVNPSIDVKVEVQVPLSIRLVTSAARLDQRAHAITATSLVVGLPKPNVTMSFRKCPKFPSQTDSTLEYFELVTISRERYSEYKDVFYFDGDDLEQIVLTEPPFRTNMSGIVSCKACNVINCIEEYKVIRFFASSVPYFTSTNLKKSEVILELKTPRIESPQTLECYASGDPYPNLTWLKDNVTLEESNQLKFAFDNRQLTILYLASDEGGRYSCRAENKHGSVEDYIDIKIQVTRLNSIVDKETPDQTGISRSSVALIVVLFALVVICGSVICKQRIKASKRKAANLAFERGAPDRFDSELSIVDQAELLPYDPKWEYPRGMLKLGKTLGSGAFGIVKKGEAKSIRRGESITTVAVKLVRSNATLNFMTALRRELKILAYLGKHPNIVNLLGACTRNDIFGELYVIVEYCRFGNLREYLLNNRDDFVGKVHVAPKTLGDSSVSSHGRGCGNIDGGERNSQPQVEGKRRSEGGEAGPIITDYCQREVTKETSSSSDSDPDRNSDDAQRLRSKYQADYADGDAEPISEHDLVYWSWQILRGMDYLGKKKIVHGDLAARNVLLADGNIVKICDFGLAKTLYKEAEYRDGSDNPLPVRWMSIEAIKDRVFSVQSDIWSFGIVMWEIFSLGETPYPGMSARGLCRKLVDGYRMGQPKYATTTVYDIMVRCWDADPTKRPSFADSAHKLGDSLDEGFKTQYFNMQVQYMDLDADIVESENTGDSPLSRDHSPASEMHEHIEINAL